MWQPAISGCACGMFMNHAFQVELISLAGYSDERSAFFMSILGIVDTVGRLVTAVIGDRLPCSRILVMPVVCLLCGAVTFMLTVTTKTAAIITYVTVIGIGRAFMYSIIYAASVETFGHVVYQESFSILLLMNGLGCLLAPLVPGLSFDLTGSYDAANYCFSILWLVCCASFLAVYFMKNYANKRLPGSKKERLSAVEEALCEGDLKSRVKAGGEDKEGVLEPLTEDAKELPPPSSDRVTRLLVKPENLAVVDKVTAV